MKGLQAWSLALLARAESCSAQRGKVPILVKASVLISTIFLTDVSMQMLGMFLLRSEKSQHSRKQRLFAGVLVSTVKSLCGYHHG